MPAVDNMGIENAVHGICGFTSTLYAIYLNRPQLQSRLDRAMDAATRRTRMQAEIKTFLRMMQAEGRQDILAQITELTRTFPNYGRWTVKDYIDKIDRQGAGDYSIAMPPEATIAYMETAWNLRPQLTDQIVPGDALLGLTRTGGPVNRWRNLAHYVYQSANGEIFSWGETFDDLAEVNRRKERDYTVVYRIMVHG